MYRSFREYLDEKGYSPENNILSILPNLDPIQQVKIDISLHKDAVKKGTFQQHNDELMKDSAWKLKLIDIFNGTNRNPTLIKGVIAVLNKDILSHQRMPSVKTGSNDWNSVWISVYQKWINILQQILRSMNDKT